MLSFSAPSGSVCTMFCFSFCCVGGFGGFLADSPLHEGFHCYNDIWSSYDGTNWTLLTGSAEFSPRAFHVVNTLTNFTDIREDASLHRTGKPPRMYLFGGGNIGYSTSSSHRIETMVGKIDGYFSTDGITWTKLSYNEGGGSSTVIQYSSQVQLVFVYHLSTLVTLLF